MDRTSRMEIIQEGLESLKKNQSTYNQAKETAKQILGKHPEISKDKDLTSLILYASSVLSKDALVEVIEESFKPKPKKFELL